MAKPRCRPGDLAILLKSKDAENIGLIVKVIELTQVKDEETYWRVETCGRLIRLVYLDDQSDAGYDRVSDFTPDSALMPIRDGDRELGAAVKECRQLCD
ncbi:hypothetical protein WK58_10320 [Burkholderia ubonensis]|uniref:hypothetical protein n=1 Tax=Burkholderia ubonensis TaxID=101571 RepID=UPI00075AEBEB|nr:hypothetical protein [Burkholderia ubonensis]KVT77676.1 hypothetical protein WK58_10320 [Burkholderia ubonensis]